MTDGMRSSFAWRLGMYLGGLALGTALIAWVALTSWSHAQRVTEGLDLAETERYRLADHLQQEVLALNVLMLRLEQRGEDAVRREFQQRSDALKRWLAKESGREASESERDLEAQAMTVYDEYLAAASRLLTPRTEENPDARLAALARFELVGERLLRLAYRLADAHAEMLAVLTEQSARSVRLLRGTLLGLVGSLVVCGSGLAVLVYRDLVQPLKRRLVAAQERAERHEKLASLGVLAAGVAHEIRNPLTAMRARIFTLQKKLDAGSPERNAADVLDDEVRRLERIVKDFLQFARPSDPEMQRVPVPDALRTVRELLNPQAEQRAVALELGTLPQVEVLADPQQLKQVLINLTQNAIEACPPGGRVTLGLRVDQRRLHQRATAVAVLEVSDTGNGMPPEVRQRLFDPFFTTKPAGVGLGLAIADRIIERHGGRLECETREGSGSVFGVILPLPGG